MTKATDTKEKKTESESIETPDAGNSSTTTTTKKDEAEVTEETPASSETVTETPEDTSKDASKDASKETAAATAATETPVEDAPPLPARPPTATERAIKELKDAFPNIEEKYVKMALIASQGQMDPAFNALLYLSDPSSDIPIPEPTETAAAEPQVDARQQQVENDEAFARSLARKYNGKHSTTARGSDAASTATAASNISQKTASGGALPSWAAKKDADEFDELYDSINKNVEQVRNKVGGWVNNLTRRMQQPQDGSYRESGYNSRAYDEDELYEKPALPRRRSQQQQQQQQQQQKQPQQQQLFSAFGRPDESTKPLPRRPSERVSPAATATTTTATSTSTTTAKTTSGDAATTSKAAASSPLEEYAPIKMTDETVDKGLEAVEPEPVSNDTFLVDDSEDEDEEDLKEAAKKDTKDAKGTKDTKADAN